MQPNLVGHRDKLADCMASGLFGAYRVGGSDAGEYHVVIADRIGPRLRRGVLRDGANFREREERNQELTRLLGEKGVAGEFTQLKVEGEIGLDRTTKIAHQGCILPILPSGEE